MPRSTEKIVAPQMESVAATPQLDEQVVASSPLNKGEISLRLAQDADFREDSDQTIYKLRYELAYSAKINGVDQTRTVARSYWIRLDGDNPLDSQEDDHITLTKKDWKPALSSWVDDESGEEYSCTWLIPKDMPYGNLTETGW
jgi:hypothetical protein